MKDILVTLPSRDRPELTSNLITQLHDHASSEDNFDVCIVVDDDQLDLYKKHINKHDIIFDVCPHINSHDGFGFNHLVMRQLEFYLSKDYYFMWILSDDTLNIPLNWDANIVCKKNFFPDNLFSLYTQSTGSKRNVKLKTKCYPPVLGKSKYDGESPDLYFKTVWKRCELLPVFTKLWVYYVYKFYQNISMAVPIDLCSAAIVQKLNTIYGENRHVSTDIDGFSITDNGNTNRIMANILKGGIGVQDGYMNIFTNVVNEMNEYIINNKTK